MSDFPVDALRQLQQKVYEDLSKAKGFSPPKSLDRGIEFPFTRLENGTYLHDRSEKDVYRILIDSYRFRMEEHCFNGGAPEPGSLYAECDSGLPAFSRYLDLAETRTGLLPPWWTPEKKQECKNFGASGREWQDLHRAVNDKILLWHYADMRFAPQLRMLAEAITGRMVGPTSSLIRRGELAEEECRSIVEELD
ncbi:hypothetical protein N0V84_011791 [Fusarium piperis]|uniref:Uncharacterized protein n=1 Tax=Fusarium piperis TaxID=1435070 RepID=A0A9W8TCW1_9HYPO|nr:hypothetical protein N0V84_011791 [Fusarium piperis]